MAQREAFSIPGAPAPIAPFSPAIKAGGLVYVSGQLPLDASGAIPDGIMAETHQCLKNMKALLEAAGSSLEKVVKCTVFITDMNEFSKMNEVYGQYFTDTPPARSAVEVSGLAKGAQVEIEAIALA